jgi:DNA-binding CsgD family transcriptional regulator
VPAALSDVATELEAHWLTLARVDTTRRPLAVSRIERFLAELPATPSFAERTFMAHAANELVFAGERCEEAVELGRRSFGEGDLLAHEGCDGMTWIVALSALGWSDDFDGYERGMEAVLEDARRRGSVMGYATASYGMTFVEYYSGRLAEAVADAEHAIDSTRYGWELFLPAACAQLAWALVEQGKLDEAAAALARVDTDPRWAASSMQPLVLEARARIHLLQRRPEAAMTDALEAGHIALSGLLPNPSLCTWRSRAALAAHQLGRRDEARRFASDELELARRFGAPRPIGIALRTLGLVEGGGDGISMLAEATEILASSPAGLEHARAAISHGSALRRADHRTAAREPLRLGLELAAKFGASPLEQHAREELASIGVRPRRTALRGVDSLTPSERRVAQMAAEGLTNREIAQALFVTLKAVEWHLRHVYMKLAIRSRSELSSALASA